MFYKHFIGFFLFDFNGASRLNLRNVLKILFFYVYLHFMFLKCTALHLDARFCYQLILKLQKNVFLSCIRDKSNCFEQ